MPTPPSGAALERELRNVRQRLLFMMEVADLHGQVFAGLLDSMRHDARNVLRGTRLQHTASALVRAADHTASLAATVLDVALTRDALGRVSTLPPRKTASARE